MMTSSHGGVTAIGINTPPRRRDDVSRVGLRTVHLTGTAVVRYTVNRRVGMCSRWTGDCEGGNIFDLFTIVLRRSAEGLDDGLKR